MKNERQETPVPTPEKPVPAEEQKGKISSTPPRAQEQTPETTPSEERGERIDTGKTIARGGKTSGEVPGAMPSKG